MADKESGVSPGTSRSQLPDSSDSEPDVEPSAVFATGPSNTTFPRSQVIHSGHFMVSSPHSDSTARRRKSGGSLRYDFDTVNRSWCQTYRFGPLSSGSLSIDPTMTRLFECMSLAYSGKIVSPKWKSFKGLRLLWRDKIRLNNAIWRAWFIQYVERRKSSLCGFVTPLEASEADAHRKPEAIVLEGSYWKRRIEVVIKEYHKWRIYHKKRLHKKKDDILTMLHEGDGYQTNLEKWSTQMYQAAEAAPAEAHMFDLDCFLSDISDTLFTMTQKPCHWTSDRHNTYTNNADIIQPGLTPLQPNLDDFMDIPDVFMNYRGQTTEHTGFADCSYFENSSSTTFTAVPSAVVSAPPPLIDSQPTQPSLSSENSSSSHTRPDHVRPGQECSEYPESSIGTEAIPYGLQSYPNIPIPTAFSTSAEQPVSASVPFLQPLPCHKLGYYTTTGVTSTVITHTASSAEAPGPVLQGQGFPHTLDMYPQTACHSLSYADAMTDPPQEPPPPVTVPHRFSMPEQLAVRGRGKHKQKKGEARTATPSVVPHDPQFTYTSCLAKLLSSSTVERKPALGPDTTLVTVKGQRSTSQPGSSSSCPHVGDSSSQHGTIWPPGMSTLTPIHSPSPTLTHRRSQASTTKEFVMSNLLTKDSIHSSTVPLIPKTEKLSPVQLYGTDRSTMSVNLPEQPGQSPSLNPLDKVSNPESPQSGFSGHGKRELSKHTETRRITHISAEQKRRFNIKMGFDTLHNLVTTLSTQPSIKISKATTLQKTAEYISKMQQERAQMHEEAQRLREEIQLLNSAINACQLQLPATGVPITRQRFDYMRQKFREYVRAQTLQNWRFWIFSIIIEPLFESFNAMVSTASVEDLCRSTVSWLDQHCSLPALRPMVLSSLRLLSTTTAILTDPTLLPEQATLAVTQDDTTAGPVPDNSLQPTTWNSMPPM
ncbi:carbohydrate-responsive element-binding protein [Cynoglossus semilaevis]|uniref:Carbohydrate-responsive element-binding protein n=1 Tax=Cynoglossus semilaevis TaxID=244447 RepID=A0A3P8VUX6_CYNSE|nr:carbohydrate-responsive element-binding protein [Cynoglossus semilaevis]